MTIQEIIKYLSETPGNTNPTVISTMVEEYASGSGGNVKVVNLMEIHLMDLRLMFHMMN